NTRCSLGTIDLLKSELPGRWSGAADLMRSRGPGPPHASRHRSPLGDSQRRPYHTENDLASPWTRIVHVLPRCRRFLSHDLRPALAQGERPEARSHAGAP